MNLPPLSESAARKINWNAIDDSLTGLQLETRGGRAAAGVLPLDREALRQVVEVTKAEFQRTLRATQVLMRIIVAAFMGTVLLVVIAAALRQSMPWQASAGIGSVGFATAFALILKIWQLNRDQMMLELIPTRYVFALELCQSPEQAKEFLQMFLEETRSLKAK